VDVLDDGDRHDVEAEHDEDPQARERRKAKVSGLT
jgi:hypothetical protein